MGQTLCSRKRKRVILKKKEKKKKKERKKKNDKESVYNEDTLQQGLLYVNNGFCFRVLLAVYL